jgi:hypothetical protein
MIPFKRTGANSSNSKHDESQGENDGGFKELHD